MPISHAFSSSVPDGSDPTLVRPSNWNAGHVVNVDLASEVTGILPANHGGTSGVTILSSATDITLTNPISSKIFVTMTTTGKKVILPAMNAANSLALGNEIEIFNSGSNAFSIVTNNGLTTLVPSLQGTGVAQIRLKDNSTVNGTEQITVVSLGGAGNPIVTALVSGITSGHLPVFNGTAGNLQDSNIAASSISGGPFLPLRGGDLTGDVTSTGTISVDGYLGANSGALQIGAQGGDWSMFIDSSTGDENLVFRSTAGGAPKLVVQDTSFTTFFSIDTSFSRTLSYSGADGANFTISGGVNLNSGDTESVTISGGQGGPVTIYSGATGDFSGLPGGPINIIGGDGDSPGGFSGGDVNITGGNGSSVGNVNIGSNGGATVFNNALVMADGRSISLGTTTGTRIGTLTSEKIGFWNATPVARQTGNPITMLTTVGLLASPTAITETQGGTNQTTYTQGDMLFASASNTLAKLAKNTTATRYISNTGTSNNPAWAQIDLTNGVTGVLPIANGGANVAAVSLTNQAADIGTTNFTNAGAAGLYRVSYALEDTTSDLTAGAVTLSIAYTDTAGATTASSGAQVLTGAGRTQGSVFIQLASGNIAYSTSHTGIFGSAKYALYMTCERLS